MAKETVRGTDVVIHFDAKRCIHARNCVLGHPDVFVPNIEGEWIRPDAVSAEEVALLARQCPSGAIQYERLDGAANEPAPVVNTVRIRENGPLAFNAPLTIAGEDAGYRATLCRCGLSKNKPYCDNSHAGGEGVDAFIATGECAAKESQPLESRDGGLNIDPQKDGPLKVSGNLEIVTGTGHTVNRTAQSWLCRCGHSQSKPYCDGSHRKSGFEAEGA
jgi:CDGSH-type Zn-finger protein/uncharacterized Fe-S cluster protein YjdI